MFFLDILQCPYTGSALHICSEDFVLQLNLKRDYKEFGVVQFWLSNVSKTYLFPVINDIVFLYKQYALPMIANDETTLSVDKQRVFDYYNQINYTVYNNVSLYADSKKWVDYRPVAKSYIENSFTNAAPYLSTGKYLLDIASGSIGFSQYLDLSKNYDYRVCVDISVNALLEAKANLAATGQKGIFICGDILNIPIKSASMNDVLSQHTLYHLPKNEQAAAVHEMLRVMQTAGKLVIVYSWFYHSWLMNTSLNVVQLYRVARHILGKLYVRLFKSKPRLYFYAHRLSWFQTQFGKSNIDVFCWRSTNQYFQKLFVHKWLGGAKLLAWIQRKEIKHSKWLGKHGEYPVIVIKKAV